MTDLSAQEIEEARKDIGAEILPDECAIRRCVEADDGAGGQTEDWELIATVACRLDPYGGATAARGEGGAGTGHAGERIDTRTSHMVTFLAGANVQALDRLEINGVTYEALALRRRGAWEMTRTVECKEKF